VIEDVSNDSRLNEKIRAMYLDYYQARSMVFAPVFAGGQWLGFINGVFGSKTQFSEQDVRRLAALAGQSAIAVQNLRLLEETRRRANQLQTAAEIARATSSTLALDTLLQRAVNQLRERFDYYQATIFLLDDSGEYAVVSESTGAAGEEMKRRGHKLSVGSPSVIGQVTETGEPMVVNDVTRPESRVIHRPNPLLPHTRAELGIPLKIGDRVIGALDVQSTTSDAFTEDDVGILETLSDQIAVALDNAQSYELAQTAVEEIREADRLKSQFLANMSHELRTPLNSIIGFSRVILKGIDGPINELQQQDLGSIYNSGQHLLGLINDVLDLSKIEAGKMDLAFDNNVCLNDIVKGVMSTTVGLVKDKSITLHQEIDPDLPALKIDPMKIRQVLLNLLSNAAKFTEEGTITVVAEVMAGPDDNSEVVVSVIDSGQGIVPEDQLKLFQPFSQVDGSLTRKTGGSGLGLSICHHLIRLHGGRIGLKSTIGEGSTFYFTLPIKPREETWEYDPTTKPELPDVDAASEAGVLISDTSQPAELPKAEDFDLPGKEERPKVELTPASQTEEPVESDPDQASLTSEDEISPVAVKQLETPGLVLAIDTDPQLVDLYKRYLADQNYTVIAVTELDQAMTVAKGIHPSIITLDVSMQSDQGTGGRVIDGWRVLKELKADQSTQDIPVIICTIQDKEDQALNMGAAGYVMKPILEEDLARVIQDVLEKRTEQAV